MKRIILKETRLKLSKSLKGRHLSEETKLKLSKALKNKMLTKSHKKKISDWHKNKTLSEEHKRRISEAFKGAKCNFWQGGISFGKYSVDWVYSLKRSIRERDRYTCQICFIEPAIDVHHIDYDKLNCNLDNLITLCHSCHSKTNNNREYWIEYFINQKYHNKEDVWQERDTQIRK